MSELITISSSVLPSSTRVAGFRGTEAISRPYQIEIFLLLGADGEDLDLADAIGAKAKLVIDQAKDGMPPFIFAGVIASIELMHEYAQRSLVRAVLVPRLWQLGLSRHSRIFTKVKITDAITAILEDNSFGADDYELRLGSYDTEEHICQYRESDLDFISRWMEREGIYYFFEHSDDGEKLILCDDKTYDEDAAGRPVRFSPQLGQDTSAGASLRTFTCRHSTIPTTVKLHDYDYARPNLAITGTARVAQNGAGEVSLYGDHRFFSPAGGQRLAKLRAEEMLTSQVVFHGTGARFHLRAGYTFELEEHPRAAFNALYLATEVHHYGNQSAGLEQYKQLLGLTHDEAYFVDLRAIPAETQFRPALVTAWPRIHGYENGVVDGPANSTYAQIDDQGRYKVKFKFDESDLKSGNASTYVRMMQPHGGTSEGFHFPLRKGTEVLFAFLDGDPDRPVIVGVVPTAVTPSPVVASNHTQNIIQTGSENYIVLEDKSGAQFINIYCPTSVTNFYMGVSRPVGPHGLTLPSGPQVPNEGKRPQTLGPFNFDLRTEGSGQIHTGGNLNLDADGMFQLEAHGLTTLYAHADWHVDVNGAANEKYWTTFTKEVVGAVDVDYKDTLNFDVTLAATENYHLTLNQTVTDAATYIYDNGLDITVNAKLAKETFNVGHQMDIKAGETVTIDGGHSTTVTTGNWDIKVPAGNANIKCIDGKLETQGKWYEAFNGDHFKIAKAMSSETTFGLKNENFIGGKVGITVAAELSLTLGLKLEFNGAITVETLGIKTEVEALQARVAGATLRGTTTAMTAIATGMDAHGMSMMMAGFRIM